MVYIAHTLALLCQSEHLPTEALIFDLFQTYKFLRFTLHIFSMVFGSNTTDFGQLPQTLSGWFAARFHLFSRAQQGFTRLAGATCWWRRNTLQLPSCSIFACPPQNFSVSELKYHMGVSDRSCLTWKKNQIWPQPPIILQICVWPLHLQKLLLGSKIFCEFFSIFKIPVSRWVGPLVTLSDFHCVGVSGPSQSVRRDWWPFRHLITVMRRHDLTKKNSQSLENA